MMRSLRLLPLALLLAVSGCDSGSDPDDASVFSGPYEGQITASFFNGATAEYEIRLDLDEPDVNGRYDGTVRIARAQGAADAVTVTGDAFGLVTGSAITLSSTAGGGDFGFGGEGTLSGSTLQLTAATLTDPAFGGSDSFSITLR